VIFELSERECVSGGALLRSALLPLGEAQIAVEKAKADLAVCLKILDGGLEGKSLLLGD